MPTDLALAIGRRRTHRLRAAHDDVLSLFGPTLIGVLSVILAVRRPAVAAAVALAGLQ